MKPSIENLMREYEDRFDDQFPLMMMRSASDDFIEASLRQCLESGKPYEGEPEVLY